MKRILQAFDNASTKPVEGANSMSKFLGIVDSAEKKEILTESVALPVQMAMQHYQKQDTVIKKESILKRYFEEVEIGASEEQNKKRQIMQQYSRMIAERVISKNYPGK